MNTSAQDGGEPQGPAEPERVCKTCGATSTPLWRQGPDGHKSLCNACGMRLQRRRAGGIRRRHSGQKARATPAPAAGSLARRPSGDPGGSARRPSGDVAGSLARRPSGDLPRRAGAEAGPAAAPEQAAAAPEQPLPAPAAAAPVSTEGATGQGAPEVKMEVDSDLDTLFQDWEGGNAEQGAALPRGGSSLSLLPLGDLPALVGDLLPPLGTSAPDSPSQKPWPGSGLGRAASPTVAAALHQLRGSPLGADRPLSAPSSGALRRPPRDPATPPRARLLTDAPPPPPVIKLEDGVPWGDMLSALGGDAGDSLSAQTGLGIPLGNPRESGASRGHGSSVTSSVTGFCEVPSSGQGTLSSLSTMTPSGSSQEVPLPEGPHGDREALFSLGLSLIAQSGVKLEPGAAPRPSRAPAPASQPAAPEAAARPRQVRFEAPVGAPQGAAGGGGPSEGQQLPPPSAFLSGSYGNSGSAFGSGLHGVPSVMVPVRPQPSAFAGGSGGGMIPVRPQPSAFAAARAGSAVARGSAPAAAAAAGAAAAPPLAEASFLGAEQGPSSGHQSAFAAGPWGWDQDDQDQDETLDQGLDPEGLHSEGLGLRQGQQQSIGPRVKRANTQPELPSARTLVGPRLSSGELTGVKPTALHLKRARTLPQELDIQQRPTSLASNSPRVAQERISSVYTVWSTEPHPALSGKPAMRLLRVGRYLD